MQNTLLVALAKEKALRALRQQKGAQWVGYQLNPSPFEQAQGYYDCTTFVAAVLRESGYNLAQPIENQLKIDVPTILPELQALPEAQRPAKLKQLVESHDARTQGVVFALKHSAQGGGIYQRDALRPGDFIQTWHSVQGHVQGHCTQVHRVYAKLNGKSLILDERSVPDKQVYQVQQVALHGAHFNDAAGISVRTKDPETLDAYLWYGVRPIGSAWPHAEMRRPV